MKYKGNFYSITLTTLALILFFFVASSTRSITDAQSSWSAFQFAYITNRDNNVSVTDTATNTITTMVNVGTNPRKIIVSFVGGRLTLPSFHSYTNSLIDPYHDYYYQDINGNGILDFNDAVAYYYNMDRVRETTTATFFAYNKKFN